MPITLLSSRRPTDDRDWSATLSAEVKAGLPTAEAWLAARDALQAARHDQRRRSQTFLSDAAAALR